MEYKIFTDIGKDPPIILLNSKVAITHFNSDTRQLFETEDGSFIYFKDEEKLHRVTTDCYTKALIKLTVFVDNRIYEQQSKALY